MMQLHEKIALARKSYRAAKPRSARRTEVQRDLVHRHHVPRRPARLVRAHQDVAQRDLQVLLLLLAGQSTGAVADLVGVTRQTVNAIEANKYSPSLEVAFLIARTLDTGIEDVFGVEEG